MQQKTWPYGTELRVNVVSATKQLIVVHAPSINEGFILMGHGVENLPKKNDNGKIIFTKGGPTGGYWRWEAPTSTRPQYDPGQLLIILRHLEEKGFQPFEWEGTADNIFTVKYKDRSGKEYTGVYRVEDGKVVEVEPGK